MLLKTWYTGVEAAKLLQRFSLRWARSHQGRGHLMASRYKSSGFNDEKEGESTVSLMRGTFNVRIRSAMHPGTLHYLVTFLESEARFSTKIFSRVAY